MKKLLLITSMAAMLAAVTASAQGYFNLSGAVRSVWDEWTPAGQISPRVAATNRIAFLIGSTANSAAISAIANSIPTNGTYKAVNAVAAWTAIMSDANFTLAKNATATTTPITALCSATGGWAISGTQPILDTVGGSSYRMIVIGWNANYATPALAAAAGSQVGWSNPFTYAAVTSIGTPATLAASGFLPFGVTYVPEPSTFAMAGLGAAAMLIFRRRK